MFKREGNMPEVVKYHAYENGKSKEGKQVEYGMLVDIDGWWFFAVIVDGKITHESDNSKLISTIFEGIVA